MNGLPALEAGYPHPLHVTDGESVDGDPEQRARASPTIRRSGRGF